MVYKIIPQPGYSLYKILNSVYQSCKVIYNGVNHISRKDENGCLMSLVLVVIKPISTAEDIFLTLRMKWGTMESQPVLHEINNTLRSGAPFTNKV